MTIYVSGDIDEDTYATFCRQLDDAVADDDIDRIDVELLSYGGYAPVGIAIAKRIEDCDKPVTVTAIGTVESAAVMILAAGHKTRMHREAWAMVHEEQGKSSGSTSDHNRYALRCKQVDEQWCRLLEYYTGTSREVWDELHRKETYLTAEECRQLCLVDEVM